MRSEEQLAPIEKQETKSVIYAMAERYGMERRAFEATLRATVVPANTSQEQFAAFLLVAKEYDLNPITKEIFAFPAKGGGIQPIVSVDGWCNIINSNPNFDGMEFTDVITDGKLVSITCRIYRKDRSHPVECTEYMAECKRNTDTWRQWPSRMLRHKALIQCARYAFGLSGIVELDEAERQDMIDVTPLVVDPKTGKEVVASASPFKTASARKEWVATLVDSYQSAQSIPELELCKDKAAKTIDAMYVSSSEKDQIAISEIDTQYDMALARLGSKELDEQMNRAMGE